MKITIKQLKKIIKEAIEPISVMTVNKKDFDPPAWSDATAPRDEEFPKARDRIGNFFMIKPGKQPKGYGSLRKRRYFYMILPDGEALEIGSIPDVTDTEGRVYLEMLNSNVTPLNITDHHDMSQQDKENWKSMQSTVLAVRDAFIEIQKS